MSYPVWKTTPRPAAQAPSDLAGYTRGLLLQGQTALSSPSIDCRTSRQCRGEAIAQPRAPELAGSLLRATKAGTSHAPTNARHFEWR